MQHVQAYGWLDLTKEPAISLTKASRLPEYVRDGRPTNPSTVYRHCVDGVLCNGERVHLEHRRQGGRIVTSVEAVRRFHERLTLRVADAAAPLPSVAVRAHADATRRLELAGL